MKPLTEVADPGKPNPGNGETVLVVDDEDYVRGILRGMLESMGFAVIEAKDGIEALELLTAHEELLACVLDLTMPGMNGMEVLGRIKETRPQLPVLLISGYSRHEVRREESRSDNVGFLQKPFTMDQFREAMISRIQGEPPVDA